MTDKKYNTLLAALVILAVGFSFTSGYIIGGTGNNAAMEIREAQAPTQAAEPTQPAPGRVQVSVDDDEVIGSANAPITIIEFSDFECPYCGRFFDETLPQIKTDYVDTGKVKIVYRDFPLQFHPEAMPAALAADCAGEQGKYYEYHNKLFENQDSLGVANFKAWASELGLNTVQFNSCLDTQKYANEINKDTQDGINAGVSGTPTFFIGNPVNGYVKVVGAQPYSVIRSVIDKELSG